MFDLSEAPFKEISVAADTTDSEAKAARKSLQGVLDDHKAAPFKPQAKNPRQRARARLRRAGKAA
jgi:hypothetical protein